MGQNTLDKGKICWQSPSNIALIKYWGKKGRQLPCNPSLSITLSASLTKTFLSYSKKKTPDGKVDMGFLFEGKQSDLFEKRMVKYLNSLVPDFPLLTDYRLKIESSNTFPHSSGIASSASAFSALALCIVSLHDIVTAKANDHFYTQSSKLARLGSGSAARSLFGGYTIWGKVKGSDIYTDEYAVPLQSEVHPFFRSYKDAILIVSSENKKVGSSAGHALMEKNPYADMRYQQAMEHTLEMIQLLEKGDVKRFIEVVEMEALTLHGLMMTSSPGYLLMQKETMEIIDRIRRYRDKNGVPVAFTLDAGPNVHVLYPESFKKEVQRFIADELLQFCARGQWIDDELGTGPKMLNCE